MSESFFEGNPYGVVRKVDECGVVFVATISASVPLRFGVIVGEVIYNLRSCLDQMICQAIVGNGEKLTHHSGFPISRSPKEFEFAFPGKVKGASTEVAALVKALKPYKGGNDGLWYLNEMSNNEKHKFPVLVAARYTELIIRPRSVPTPYRFPQRRVILLQAGTELSRVVGGPEVNVNPEFTFRIAFGENQILEGEPVIELLQQLADWVEGTIQPFEAFL
jgi:hypothetical protein